MRPSVLLLRCAAALAAASSLLVSPVAGQGGPGGPGGPGGGAGGTYRGPGDTVPSNPGSPPTGPPPAAPGGPPDAGPGGPVTPPPTAPPGPPAGTPPPGLLPPLPPDEPETPGALPPTEDATSWQIWWHYNRWDYLPLGASQQAIATGGEAFFLGRGQVPQEPRAPRATPEDVATLARPALLRALEGGGRRELVVFALQALARLGDDPAGAGPAGTNGFGFDEAARRHLRDDNQAVTEGALLAVGLRGDRAWTSELVSVMLDGEQGRRTVGRSKVGHRLRAFAAYGLALLADRTQDPIWRLEVHRVASGALPGERPEVQAALLIAIGHAAMPWKDAGPEGTSAVGPVTLDQQIELVAAFLEDGRQAALARSQAPQALALLAREAPEALRERVAGVLLDQVGTHAKAPTEVKNGAVLALGSVARSGEAPIDVEARKALERIVVGPGADKLTRFFALIALAQSASRPGVGDEPLAGLEPARRFLLRQVDRERGMQRAWAALALGVLEHASLERGAMAAPESARMLREVLGESRNGDVAGAIAIALGLLGDREASEGLDGIVRESGSPVLRGYASLALGMVRDPGATETLREALRSSTGLPGSLQRIAIGLSLLGDPHVGPNLARMLLDASSPEAQASIAAAVGWTRDPRPLPMLAERLREPRDDAARAWLAVAVGRIAEPDERPWIASFSVGANYDAPLETLRDPSARLGLLDYP